MNPSKKITLAICLGIAFVSCSKQYNVDGQVVSRHDIPVPNALVKLRFAEGSHSCCEDNVVDSTDSNGKFSFRGRVGGIDQRCIYSIEASFKDSGGTGIGPGVDAQSHGLLLKKKIEKY